MQSRFRSLEGMSIDDDGSPLGSEERFLYYRGRMVGSDDAADGHEESEKSQ